MDGSVTIGVSVDSSSVTASLEALESRISSLASLLNAESASGFGEGFAASLASLAEAIASQSANIYSAVRSVALSAAGAFSSVPWRETGSSAASSVASGMSSGSTEIAGSASLAAQAAAAAFSEGGWHSIGANMISGVAAGVRSAGAEVVSAIRAVSRDAEEAVKSYYKIQSPSALMRDEVGVMISRGIAEVILAGGGAVEYALSGLVPAEAGGRGASRGSAERNGTGRGIVQNIYLRDSDSSPYRTAKRIRKESEAARRYEE